ncbi:hypothetical protein DACRYDRAFT_109576 [Dacryopinax primogenitus]|uniref:Uncharacterized protein n=1 Tax=Dacryopinax primogenitus (strain DJM 731) TaxID=1858805 RepID=M5G6T9_DACPD|nr:uncharacterized protein DACRYDRAFT_109576 [Dacryopinax primogenitus]EJT99472.1 hypothetical protein DACRYDRAFT_109576 [Dacryopinax primogenitus]
MPAIGCVRRLRGVLGGLLAVAGLANIASSMQHSTTLTPSRAFKLHLSSSPGLSAEGDNLFGLDDGSRHLESVVSKDGSIPQTKLLVHVAGTPPISSRGMKNRAHQETVFLIDPNNPRGTLYVVNNQSDTIPDVRFIASSGRALQQDPTPTQRDFANIWVETMWKSKQIKLASQTTIMLGVHGNGLSNLLWMENPLDRQ